MYNTERSEITHVIYDDVMMRNEDRGERVEMKVDIYDSVDAVRHHDLRTHAERHQTLQHTGSNVIYLIHRTVRQNCCFISYCFSQLLCLCIV